MVGNRNRRPPVRGFATVTLGIMTLRNGHGWMFFFGIFFPLLWIIGAFMRPPREYA